MSAIPDAHTGQFGARSRNEGVHLVVVLILSAFPAAAAAAFGPSMLENQTFLSLYVLTLPWSLALCAIAAGFAGGWFGSGERKQVLAAAGILLLSAVVGRAIAPGASVEEHFQGGSPVVVASEAIVFGVIGYALVYGWATWFASFFLAAYVGWWVHEKREPEEFVDVARAPALTARVVQTSPARPIASGTVPLERPMPMEPQMPPPKSPPSDDLGGLTKAELYQRARDVGIKGRSAMSKAQLLAALRANQ